MGRPPRELALDVVKEAMSKVNVDLLVRVGHLVVLPGITRIEDQGHLDAHPGILRIEGPGLLAIDTKGLRGVLLREDLEVEALVELREVHAGVEVLSLHIPLIREILHTGQGHLIGVTGPSF